MPFAAPELKQAFQAPALVTRPLMGARKGARKRGKKGKAARGTVGLMPPALNVTPTDFRVLRFRNTSATLKSITAKMILSALGGIVTVTNTTFVGFCSAFKLKKILIWPAIGSPTFGTVDWAGGSYAGVSKEKQVIYSVPTGVTTEPGPLEFSIPSFGKGENYIASAWIDSQGANAVMFDISCTVGSIIDVHLSYQLANEIPGVSQTLTGSGSLGGLGYMCLDGPGGVYTPNGVPFLT